MPPTKPSGRKTATVVHRGAGDGACDFTRARNARLAHGVALAAVPVDVLEDDDGVVHYPADGYCQPSSVMMLIVIPATSINVRAVMMETGMLTAATRVDRRLSRKKKMVRIAKNAPRRPSRTRLSRDSMM